MSTPAARIRLRLEGQPQEIAEPYALVLVSALEFCAKPETFPVFIECARRENADADWAVQAMAALTPEILLAINRQIAGGIMADFEAQP